MKFLKNIHEEEFLNVNYLTWKMFYKEIQEQNEPGTAFSEHLEAQIYQLWWWLCGFNVCTVLLKKNSGDVTATNQLNHNKSQITGPQKPHKRDASVASYSNLTK